MTTFIFVMKPDTSSAEAFRMLSELEEQFPDDDFILGDARFGNFESNILATVEGDGAMPPAPGHVAKVAAFFRRKLREFEGWKPS